MRLQVYSGKLVRVDMRDFGGLAKRQLAGQQQQQSQQQRGPGASGATGSHYNTDADKDASRGGGGATQNATTARLTNDPRGSSSDDGSRTGTNLLGHDGVQVGASSTF